MGLFKKGTKLYGIFNMKCARCHEGDLFETPTFSFSKPFEMKERCPVCGQNYMPEPGFYYGAMFISYIFTGFFCLGFVGFCILVLGLDVNTSFFWLLFVCTILFVWIFRMARSVWFNLMVGYQKGLSE